MKIIDDKYIFEDKTIVTIGKFDGFHLGHSKIIDKMLSLDEGDAKTLVVSFVNHPGMLISKNFDGLLLSKDEKIEKASELGVDYYIELLFDEKLLNTSAEDFFDEYIINKWNCDTLVVGDDFSFGKNRTGNIEFLKSRCLDKNIELYVVPRRVYKDEAISSSRIKNYIKAGDITNANECLGYEYSFAGEIVSGNKIGRTIDFPTINILNDNMKVLPKFGVYKTLVNIDSIDYKGITNVGVKPTVDNSGKVVIETHILDFDQDVYGKRAEVRLLDYVRPEFKFSSLEELKKQIELDKKCWTE